jgi:neutral ceramidase
VRGVRAAALALLVLVVSAGATHAGCDDCVTAGAGRAALAVPSGTSLGGYGAFARRLLLPDVFGLYPHAFWLKPSLGARDELTARALVLERDGTRVTWLTLDVVAVDRSFMRTLGARLGGGVGTLLVSASHTHSGPGGYVDSVLAGMLVMDRLDRAVLEAIVAAAESAVRRAEATRAPARVAFANIAGPAIMVSRLRQPLDHELMVLGVRRPDGAPVAVVWNFAIHGTMLGPRNRELSGDVIGVASQHVEKEIGAPALFVAGALADVSPARHGADALQTAGTALGATVLDGWRAAKPVAPTSFMTRTATLALPAPRLSLRNCLGRFVPRAFTLPLGRMFPREATLTAVALGDVAWITVPGELQTALGRRLKAKGRETFGDVFVAGVSNDYLGYLVTATDYERPSYVTCASVYAPDTGEQLAERATDLLSELRGRPRPPAAPTR